MSELAAIASVLTMLAWASFLIGGWRAALQIKETDQRQCWRDWMRVLKK